MLRNIKQSDKGLIQDIQDVGCLFLCFAQVSPLVFEDDEGRKALNKIWKEAKNKGYISPDNIIMHHNKLANEFFALDVRYDDKHHGVEETIPSSVLYVFGKYTYNYNHFVVLNKNKEVIFDSYGTSNTVKYGKLESTRWYYAV